MHNPYRADDQRVTGSIHQRSFYRHATRSYIIFLSGRYKRARTRVNLHSFGKSALRSFTLVFQLKIVRGQAFMQTLVLVCIFSHIAVTTSHTYRHSFGVYT